jgi:hypothetical protein
MWSPYDDYVIYTAILAKYSDRAFHWEAPIRPKKKPQESLLEASIFAPTSCTHTPWEAA